MSKETTEIPVKTGFESWDSPAIQDFMTKRKDSAWPYTPSLKEGETTIYPRYRAIKEVYRGDFVEMLAVQVGDDGETSLKSLFGASRRFVVRKSDGSKGQSITIDNLLPYSPAYSTVYARNAELNRIIGEGIRVKVTRLTGWWEGSESRGWIELYTFTKVD